MLREQLRNLLHQYGSSTGQEICVEEKSACTVVAEEVAKEIAYGNSIVGFPLGLGVPLRRDTIASMLSGHQIGDKPFEGFTRDLNDIPKEA